MRIAAIYIEEHQYLFDTPQTINFGGKYFYDFKVEDEELLVTRTLNENFIQGFFDSEDLDSVITNVNAIVGQNGAGKSTLLDVIRSKFIQDRFALPHFSSLTLAESDDSEYPIIIQGGGEVFLQLESSDNKKIKLKKVSTKSIQTIYYSPHYDYKFNPNFDEVDNHDISFDKILEKDLEELHRKETQSNGFDYSPSQELLFKNAMRQIEFLSSNLVEKHKIFQNIFQLQGHYEPTLYFRGYKITEKYHNTPMDFRGILREIDEKIESESKKWDSIRRYKGKELINQFEVNQYLLKRDVLMQILNLINGKMEQKNDFLGEGFILDEKGKEIIDELNAYEAFLFFIKNSAIKFRESEPIKVFNYETVEKLVTKIYSAIEKQKNEDFVTRDYLHVSTEDAIEILTLQRQFLNELSKYYYLGEDSIVKDNEKLEGFVNYMPFTRRLSSGENALLNLFSRLYDFLNANLKSVKSREPKDHYILLLDEGDLGFHLVWKKKYVKSLLKTLPYFFNELDNKPSLQIIFTTHDPLTLSDLPNSNVIYIERRDYDSKSNILDYNHINRPSRTFGANISDLIADSFFIEKSLIGDFAFEKIREAVDWLNRKEDKENAEYYKSLIKIIDEPIVQRKLSEMYDEKMESDFQINVVEEQIKKLQELRNKLTK